jgi:hypothetical protein
LVAMHVEDLPFATSVLQRAGFKVLGQDDVSR